MKERPKSEYIYRQLCEVIPGGVNSPVRACKSMRQLPLVVESARGDMLVDADGHAYIDYCGSWGALIHGHAHPVITAAVCQRLQKGSSFGVTTALEGELARAIAGQIAGIEKIRFVSSGTEATMSAVRLARGFTQREILVKFNGNYHGHADFFLAHAGSGLLETSPTASSEGVPLDMVRHTVSLPYNDLAAWRACLSHPLYTGRIAAVIVEPVAGNMGVVPAELSFIQALRAETQKIGALLIFDEVITAFRVHAQGAQALYAVQPDLICLGKIMGGGFPAAAFGGRREIMDSLAPLGGVYQAGTLSGNPVAMEAGLQSLRLLQQPGFYAELERKTALLLEPIKARIQQESWQACLQQAGSMFTLFLGKKQVRHLEEALQADGELYARLFRTLFAQGIYIPPSPHEAWFISAAHEEAHLIQTREAILAFLESAYGV